MPLTPDDADYRYSINTFPGDGATITWDINFAGGYISTTHVKARVTDAFGGKTDRTLVFTGPNTVEVEPPVATGSTLTIYRDTPVDAPIADFTDGADITEKSLDTNAEQAVFTAAENRDYASETLAKAQEALDLANLALTDIGLLVPGAVGVIAAATPYKAQVGYLATPGAGELLFQLYFDRSATFPPNFSLNTGKLLGLAPSSTLTITLRKLLADGTDVGAVGTIVVSSGKVISFTTAGGVSLVMPAGSTMQGYAPSTPVGSTNLAIIMQATNTDPSAPSTPTASFYRAQVGYIDTPGAGELLFQLYFDAPATFPANFSLSAGQLLGTAPTGTLIISLKKVLADGTDAGIVGTISVSTGKVISFATTGGAAVDMPVGSTLQGYAPVTTVGSTNLVILMQAST